MTKLERVARAIAVIVSRRLTGETKVLPYDYECARAAIRAIGRSEDTRRLDWLLTPGHDLGVRDIRPGRAYGAGRFFDTRREIDAAMKARRSERGGGRELKSLARRSEHRRSRG